MIFGKKNNQRDFEKIYDQMVGQVFRFAYLKVSSKEEAEDITSKAFLKLWQAYQKEEEIKNPKAFVYQITRNLVIDYYRQNLPDKETQRTKRPHTTIEKVVAVDKEMRADQVAILNSQIEEVKEALSNIKEEYQDIIIWYYLDELTAQEIALLIDKPESNVRVLIHRALNALKKQMK